MNFTNGIFTLKTEEIVPLTQVNEQELKLLSLGMHSLTKHTHTPT